MQETIVKNLMSVLPLQELSPKQWSELLKLSKLVELTDGRESELFRTLQIVMENHSRIEIINQLY